MSNTIGNFTNKVQDMFDGGKVASQGEGSTINTEDTFKETGGEGVTVGKTAIIAGMGVIAGVAAATKSEVSNHEKRLNELEKRMNAEGRNLPEGIEKGEDGPSTLQSIKEKAGKALHSAGDAVGDIAGGVKETIGDYSGAIKTVATGAAGVGLTACVAAVMPPVLLPVTLLAASIGGMSVILISAYTDHEEHKEYYGLLERENMTRNR